MQVKEESEKAGLRCNIPKTKIMASGPLISWQIDGKTVVQWQTSVFLDSKIMAGDDCSYEIKWHLFLGNCDKHRLHVKEQRHSFAKKRPYSQSYICVFLSSHVTM